MCAGAIVLARLDRLVYGAWDPKAGAVGSLWDVVRDRRLNHRPEVVSGVLAAESAATTSSLVRGEAGLKRRLGSITVECPSGRRSTPRKRVRGQLLRGFKSHLHRQALESTFGAGAGGSGGEMRRLWSR